MFFNLIAPVSSPSLSKYQMNYAASFKGPCLTTAFSRDSKLVACGSADLSIKVNFNIIIHYEFWSATGDGC